MTISISGVSLGNVGGPSNISLDDLTDVVITTPQTGQYLRYDGTSTDWENAFISSSEITTALGYTPLSSNQSISITSDATGSGTTSIALTLATVNSNVGSFGSTAAIPVITVNAKGLITAVSTASTSSFVTVTGAQTLTNKTLTGYTETVFAVTGTTPSLSVANGTIQTWALSGNSTPTNGLTSGQSMTLMVNDGTAFTITWSSIGVVWTGGTAPTLATTGYTVIELWMVGSTVYGATPGNVA